MVSVDRFKRGEHRGRTSASALDAARIAGWMWKFLLSGVAVFLRRRGGRLGRSGARRLGRGRWTL